MNKWINRSIYLYLMSMIPGLDPALLAADRIGNRPQASSTFTLIFTLEDSLVSSIYLTSFVLECRRKPARAGTTSKLHTGEPGPGLKPEQPQWGGCPKHVTAMNPETINPLNSRQRISFVKVQICANTKMHIFLQTLFSVGVAWLLWSKHSCQLMMASIYYLQAVAVTENSVPRSSCWLWFEVSSRRLDLSSVIKCRTLEMIH